MQLHYLFGLKASASGEYKSVSGAWDKWFCSCSKSATSQNFALLTGNLMLCLFPYSVIGELLSLQLSTSLGRLGVALPVPLGQAAGCLDGQALQKSHFWFQAQLPFPPIPIERISVPHQSSDPLSLMSKIFSSSSCQVGALFFYLGNTVTVGSVAWSKRLFTTPAGLRAEKLLGLFLAVIFHTMAKHFTHSQPGEILVPDSISYL